MTDAPVVGNLYKIIVGDRTGQEVVVVSVDTADKTAMVERSLHWDSAKFQVGWNSLGPLF